MFGAHTPELCPIDRTNFALTNTRARSHTYSHFSRHTPRTASSVYCTLYRDTLSPMSRMPGQQDRSQLQLRPHRTHRERHEIALIMLHTREDAQHTTQTHAGTHTGQVSNYPYRWTRERIKWHCFDGHRTTRASRFSVRCRFRRGIIRRRRMENQLLDGRADAQT